MVASITKIKIKMSGNEKKRSDASGLKKIVSKIRYGLTLQSIRNVLIRIGIDISPYYWFQEGINITKIPEIQGSASDYSFELLGPEDMKILETLGKGWSRPLERIPALLEGKEKCIAIKCKDEIAAFMWINLIEFKYKSIVVPLKSNEAYLTDMFTVEGFRGKNLAPCLRYKSYEMLKEMGRDTFYSISISFNTPAVRFKEKLEAKKVDLILLIQLFRKFHTIIKLKTF